MITLLIYPAHFASLTYVVVVKFTETINKGITKNHLQLQEEEKREQKHFRKTFDKVDNIGRLAVQPVLIQEVKYKL